MPLSDHLKPFDTALAQEAHLVSWLRRYRLETMLTDTVRRRLPRLVAEQTRVTDLRNGQLKLSVPSGAVATVVKQHAPDLIKALASQGYEFKSILVHVQPPRRNKSAKNTEIKRMPPPRALLCELERKVSSERLKQAIRKLMKRC
ncbi:MAG: DciA family protein [Burkholderiales bacterium]|jgi:hypothetical protein|nr:DciA family protein [Burkholderiales bacterium]